MLYGKPVYMYRFPNMTAPDGSIRNIDNNPAVMVPHVYNMVSGRRQQCALFLLIAWYDF
jgi:hypothetical protein